MLVPLHAALPAALAARELHQVVTVAVRAASGSLEADLSEKVAGVGNNLLSALADTLTPPGTKEGEPTPPASYNETRVLLIP